MLPPHLHSAGRPLPGHTGSATSGQGQGLSTAGTPLELSVLLSKVLEVDTQQGFVSLDCHLLREMKSS